MHLLIKLTKDGNRETLISYRGKLHFFNKKIMKQSKAIIIKQDIVKDIVNKINKAASIYLFEYHGLDSSSLISLREKLNAENAQLKIWKNTLLRKAFKNTEYTNIIDDLEGPNAIIFSYGDEIAGARELYATWKKHKKVLKIKSGIFEKKYVDSAKVTEIAKIPGREQLITMFASSLLLPIREFLYLVKQVGETKEDKAVETKAKPKVEVKVEPKVEKKTDPKKETEVIAKVKTEKKTKEDKKE